MEWVETEIKNLPGNGRILTVSVADHPAIQINSVLACLERPSLRLLLPRVPDVQSPEAALRHRYQIVLPSEVRAGDLKVKVNFRGNVPFVETIELGSVFERFLLKYQLIYEKKKLKRLRRARKRRRRKHEPFTWDAFTSKLTIFFLRRIWTRWVRIRYGEKARFFTIANPERIGHLAAESEILYCEVENRVHPAGRYCLVLPREVHVEDVGYIRVEEKLKKSYLLKMLKRRHLVMSVRARDMGLFSHRMVARRAHQQRDVYGTLDSSRPRLSFTPEEIDEGWRQLKPFGLTPETPFVCLHLRESGYVRRLYNVNNFPSQRYSYRDVTTQSYVPAIRYLMDQGFRVVRLGVPPVEPCLMADERYIDYANAAQTPFLDIFLCAQCGFFLGTTSGLYAVADLFRRPILYTNFAPLRHIHSWSVRYLTIPKVAYYHRIQRLLTIEEMLLPGLGDVIHGEKIAHFGIDYLANTEEEILEGTKEMVGRVRDQIVETPQDRELQARFWSTIPRDNLNQEMRARVGAHFLRKYQNLLPAKLSVPAGIPVHPEPASVR